MKVIIKICVLFFLISCSNQIIKEEKQTHIVPETTTDLCSKIDDNSFNIIIMKKQRQLYLCKNKMIFKQYIIGLGLKPQGNKETEGDMKTPEGIFFICDKKENNIPDVLKPRALMLNYPNKEHADRGLKNKIINQKEYNKIIKALNENKIPSQITKLGGEVYIHGSSNKSDWTEGCIAMNFDDIIELYELVEVGVKVRIFA